MFVYERNPEVGSFSYVENMEFPKCGCPTTCILLTLCRYESRVMLILVSREVKGRPLYIHVSLLSRGWVLFFVLREPVLYLHYIRPSLSSNGLISPTIIETLTVHIHHYYYSASALCRTKTIDSKHLMQFPVHA